ncbi:MAG: hypothetical protein M0R51_14765 [Clostridia bacterium]|jgi:hypothetical protein|nr:hypothetical protein [Clostridia bacterium]
MIDYLFRIEAFKNASSFNDMLNKIYTANSVPVEVCALIKKVKNNPKYFVENQESYSDFVAYTKDWDNKIDPKMLLSKDVYKKSHNVYWEFIIVPQRKPTLELTLGVSDDDTLIKNAIYPGKPKLSSIEGKIREQERRIHKSKLETVYFFNKNGNVIYYKTGTDIDAGYDSNMAKKAVYMTHNHPTVATNNPEVFSVADIEPLLKFKNIKQIRIVSNNILYTLSRGNCSSNVSSILNQFENINEKVLKIFNEKYADAKDSNVIAYTKLNKIELDVFRKIAIATGLIFKVQKL